MVLSDSIICFVLLFLSLSASRAVVSRRSLLRLSVRCRSTQKKSITVHRKILPCSVDFFFLFLYALNIILFCVLCLFVFFLPCTKSWNQKICFATLMYYSHIYD